MLLLAGCATAPSARGSRLLPWNWFASDSTAKVEKAEAKGAAAESSLRRDAQRNALATAEAIAAEKSRQLADGGVSRELTTAEDYAGRTVRALDASEGFLAFDVRAELTEMVRLRNSQVAAERARGDKLLAATDALATKAAEAKVRSDTDIAAAHKKVAAEQQRALVAEEKYNRIWFWVYVAVSGYVLLQLLPLLAKVFPGFGPLAHFSGMVLSPVAQATLGKMKRATGQLIHAAETGATVSAAAIRERFDGPLAESDQAEIARNYHLARAKASASASVT